MLREHPGAVKMRQLAPPALVISLFVSLLLVLSPVWWLGIVAPSAYAVAVIVVSIATTAARRSWEMLRLCAVFPAMHLGWGCGFLFGRRLAEK